MQAGDGFTLVVIGVGLIGGSFALDLRRAGRVSKVIGVGRSPENLQRAIQLKVIDEADTLESAVSRADLVLIATPVGQMEAIMRRINACLPPHALVTDAGSTKVDVCALYHRCLPDHLDRCVPGHPIAGSDLSGAAAARFALFEQRKVVLTPLQETASGSVERIRSLWQSTGAQVVEMSAREHDDVFATVSHLPHLLAFAYMNHVLNRPHADRCLQLAASGFRDFTRIAGSHPEMWRDIAMGNREALLDELQLFRDELDLVIRQLGGQDGQAMRDGFARASEVRAKWRL
ncbi:prephenate dehydrogenase/arogenate dehydrogenase family protein [Burkholderiaceae bacterium DAT-1]|nr:prephenate dehydrogenase/arogenate dehydrogenase family protein [Burkholderiaceae bacterium DAT-1]